MTSVDIAEFVKARLDEDDYWANIDGGQPRKQREVAAKRAVLAAYVEVAYMDTADPEPEFAYGRAVGLGEAVRQLAAAWSDHPDYRQEWAQ